MDRLTNKSIIVRKVLSVSAPLRFTILLYSAALAISLSAAVILPVSKADALSPEAVAVELSPSRLPYVLRADHGELCVFQGSVLLRRTGVAVAALPEKDRTALEGGIAVSTKEDLTSLLEDLCS